MRTQKRFATRTTPKSQGELTKGNEFQILHLKVFKHNYYKARIHELMYPTSM
jgi:hypothetical protein